MPTIQQIVYEAIPASEEGIAVRSLKRSFRLHAMSVKNAVYRLYQMGLVVRVGTKPSRYRRAGNQPCPPDRRGRSRNSHAAHARKSV